MRHGAGAPRLARPLDVERHCDENREAELAALRVVLGLPRVQNGKGGDDQ